MTEPISIGTNTIPNLLYDKLNQEMQYLKKEGFPLNIDIDRVGDFTFLDCHMHSMESKDMHAFETAKAFIANCLAQVIVDEWEERIIKKIVRNSYYYYNDDEKKVILKKAGEILSPIGKDSYHQNQRKEKVMLKILDYLDLHQELILEGFINFRLKEYQNELENIVNSAVDEFLLEKEYMEFIRLLRYFVEIQEPRIDKVNIVFRRNGKFSLLDDEKKPVQHESLDGLMMDLMENEINYDDLLISALITLAPREVELHVEGNTVMGDTMKTIENVFGKRVIRCKGCILCNGEKKNK